MKLRTLLCGSICVAVGTVLTGGAASTGAPAGGEQELRDAVQKAASICPFHKKLRSVKGQYDQTIKWWRSSTAEPLESTSRSNSEWVLGGRFLKQEFSGKWLDMPFKGIGLIGYDKGAKEYTSMWMDSLGTKMLHSRGTCEDKCKEITMLGEYIDSITGETVKARTVLQLPNKKGETSMEVFRTTSDGKEYKFLEVVTKRRLLRGA